MRKLQNEYTLRDAVKFARRMERYKTLLTVNITELGRALKTLADAGNTKYFRMVIDSYVRCAKSLPVGTTQRMFQALYGSHFNMETAMPNEAKQ